MQIFTHSRRDSTSNEDELAKYAVRLALTFSNWVHRRTETFQFVDANTVRRRMSVDFTLPPSEQLAEGDIVYVPLMILEKEDLRHLDVVDEAGNSLQVLTTQQNGTIAERGLHFLLLSSWPKDQDLPIDVIAKITTGDRCEAKKDAAATLANDGAITVGLAGFDQRDQVRALINDLAEGFLFLVPLQYRPGSRRLVKFSYDAALGHRSGQGFARQAYRRMTRLASSLGLMARLEEFSDLAIGWAESYHAEAVPAPGTYSAEATLEVERSAGIERSRDRHRSRPHLRAAGKSRGDSGQLALLFQARRDGLILPLLVSAAVIAGALAFVPKRSGHIDGQTLGALLLAPFALAAFYARSSENSYVTNALRGVRLVATVPVAAGVLVLSMLGLGYLGSTQASDSDTALSIARWSAHVALWSTVALFLALINPKLGSWTRPGMRWVQDRSQDKDWSNFSRIGATVSIAVAGIVGLAAIAGVVLYGLYAVLPI